MEFAYAYVATGRLEENIEMCKYGLSWAGLGRMVGALYRRKVGGRCYAYDCIIV